MSGKGRPEGPGESLPLHRVDERQLAGPLWTSFSFLLLRPSSCNCGVAAWTSGHTTAHQAVLVRLPHTGPVLLTIDSVSVQSAFTMDRKASQMDENEQELLVSTRKLLDLVQREHIDLIIFGHDAQQWQTLKKAPEYYD